MFHASFIITNQWRHLSQLSELKVMGFQFKLLKKTNWGLGIFFNIFGITLSLFINIGRADGK